MTPPPALGATLAVEVSSVSHRFDDETTALLDVSLSVRSGEFVSVVGPSGCGKTTILNLLAGLISLQSGTIRVHGEAPRAGRRDVAYMLARDALLPWASAQANVEFGARIRGTDTAARRQRARTLLASVGLSGFEHAYPKALSQGMRQRVALARTFCLDAPILLMDEPFGALDAQTKLQLEDVLLALWTEQRRTVVFVTHDLSEAVALSDKVIVMSRRPGRVQADIEIPLPHPRSVRQLQRDPAFHNLYTRVWDELEQGLSR